MSGNTRVAKWDNVKLVLILSVVTGHIINYFKADSALLQSLHFFIYTFHMPAFIFVSGLMMKRTIRDKRYDKIFSYLMLYLAIKVIHFLVIYHGKAINLFSENGIAWYAFVIFAFCLMTVFLQQFDWRYVLTAAVIFGCIAGYDKNLGNFLVLGRITSFYPFFLLGFYLEPQKLLEFGRKYVVKAAAVVVLFINAWISLRYYEQIKWLLVLLKGKSPYAELEQWSRYGGFLRLGFYVWAMLLTIAIIALVPNVKCFVTKLGSRTLQIYVFHYCLIDLFVNQLNGGEWLKTTFPEQWKILVILTAVLIVLITSLRPFGWLIEKIIYPGKNKEEAK